MLLKFQLITSLTKKLPSLTEKDVEFAINQILETISSSLSKGERVEIRGFGSFSIRYRRARNAHNPKTGIRVVTKPKYIPYFKPGKELRERVNANRNIQIEQ